MQGFAALLDQRAAGGIAAGAGDAAAVGRQFAAAVPAAQIAVAQGLSVVDAAEPAHAGVEHAAEVLEHILGHFVIAGAMDFAPVFALLDFHRAARQNLKTASRCRTCRGGECRPHDHRGLRGTPFFRSRSHVTTP